MKNRNKKLNQKGFTLVELLAVLVILIAIMEIAIPSISSSLERTKDKQNASRYKVLESYADLYVADHKNAVWVKANPSCYILISKLEEGGYATPDDMMDADDNDLSGHYIIFTKPSTFKYQKTNGGLPSCI